jgi:hypothetical protein
MRTVLSKKAFIAFIAGFAFCAGLLILVLFPVHQSVSTWKGYRILAVTDSSREPEILDLLAKAGIRGIVSEANSAITSGDPQTPVLPFLADVNAKRARWFSDKTGKSRLLYLEDTAFLDLNVKKAFDGSNFSWILERSGQFSFIPVACLGIFLLAGVLSSRKKGFLLVCGIPFIILSASCNDLVGLLSAILSVSVLLLIEDAFGAGSGSLFRKRLPSIIRARPLYALSVPVPFIVSMIGGFQHAALLLAALILAIAAGGLFTLARDAIRIRLDARRLHPSFRPVKIVPLLPGIDIDWKRLSIMVAIGLSVLAAGMISLAIPKTGPATGNPAQELYIPAPSGYTARNGFTVEGFKEIGSLKNQNDLPDLSDFITTRWNIRIYPWKKIRSPLVRPEPGDTLDTVRYFADDSGKITDEQETLDTFDSGFIRKTLSTDGTPLERLLMHQGEFVSVTFKRLM